MTHMEILNPYNLQVISKVKRQSSKEVDLILEKSYSLLQNRKKWLPLYERISILEKTYEILKEKSNTLILQALSEGGKPLNDSKIEIERGLEGIKVALKEISNLKGTEVPMGITPSSQGRKAYTRREPRGVVVAISAFNHPFNLIIHQVMPAVATGCPIIIKPASTTPLSCQAIVKALYEAGLPEDWCKIVNCDNNVAEKLVTDSRNSFLTFIGSSRVGWSLRSKLPPGATCALEHGGIAPVIIDETADLSKAVPSLVKGGYYHAGQVCVSAQRIYVHESKLDQFTENFVAQVKKLKVGDPKEKETEIGPLILPREVERVDLWVNEAKKSGGTLLCGGKKLSETCYEPTIIREPSEQSKLSTNEVFGPVTCLYPYKTQEEAIARANGVNFAFQASVYSTDLNKSLSTAEALEGMTVMINDHPAFRVDWMPFGGYKHSGLGLGGIPHSMRDMTLEKMIVLNFS